MKDPTPVLLKNPYQVSPYTFLIGLVSTPSYKELDPSLFMYFTFPIFFSCVFSNSSWFLRLILKRFYTLSNST